jgi:hypothetical protein
MKNDVIIRWALKWVAVLGGVFFYSQLVLATQSPYYVFDSMPYHYKTYSVYSVTPDECRDAPVSIKDISYKTMYLIINKRSQQEKSESLAIYPCSEAVERQIHDDFVLNKDTHNLNLRGVNIVGFRTDVKEASELPLLVVRGEQYENAYFYFMTPSKQSELVKRAISILPQCDDWANRAMVKKAWNSAVDDYYASARDNNLGQQEAFVNLLSKYRCVSKKSDLRTRFYYVGDKQASGWIAYECLWGGMSTAVADFAYKPLLDDVVVYIHGVADGEKIQMPNLSGFIPERISRGLHMALYAEFERVAQKNTEVINDSGFRYLAKKIFSQNTVEGMKLRAIMDGKSAE